MRLPSIGALKPYPTMKDSGVELLGTIPSHWDMKRLKFVARIVAGQSPPSVAVTDGIDGLPFLQGNAEFGPVNPRHSQVCDSAPKRAEPGDILLSVRAPVGAMNKADRPYGIGRGLCAIRPTPGIDRSFCFYEVMVLRPLLHAMARGSTYDAVTTSDVGDLPTLLPHGGEQHAIVRFLDHADRRIRRYIRAKQKLIALLVEQKQAIIHQTVTGQIDVRTGEPYPSYRVSGVEWLGDVPGHWEVAALHHRYSQCLGKMLDSKRLTGTHSVPYLRNVDVQWDQINTKDLPTMDIPPDEYERYTVQEDDLLVCEGGEIGRCALWSGEVAICGFQKALHRLRPRNARQDVPRFMHYALRAAAKGNAFSDGHLSTIAHLTGEKLRSHRFPFPPVAEQESLVRFLDGVLNQADHSVSCVRRQIDVLREYRTRLIADVVTGKLDVRETAAGLPETDVPSDTDELAEE